MLLQLVVLLALTHHTAALSVAVLSKIIVDRVDGKWRPGGGGVQATVGVRLASDCGCALFAPVGADFDYSMLQDLTDVHGVDISEVRKLPHVRCTPGELISYAADGEMLFENVGWDGWDALCSWVPDPQRHGGADFAAWHIIAEGGGRGEAEAVLTMPPGALPALVSVEPVMHHVDAPTVEQLARLTRLAAVVSPDLRTAESIAHIGMDRDAAMKPGGAAVVAAAAGGTDDAATLRLLACCAAALALDESALLAVRNGADGSLLYQPKDPTCFIRVPAVQLDCVADPTGAGNAYAGALCAMLAAGAPVTVAAATASAVGAALCRTADWAPRDAPGTRAWVNEQAKVVRERSAVCRVGGAQNT